MNTQDEAAWEREFDHVESKQKQHKVWEPTDEMIAALNGAVEKQREGWDGRKSTITTVIADSVRTPMNYYPSVWRGIKTGTEYEK